MPAITHPYGTGQSDYEKYIRTEELFKLQHLPDEQCNDDELLFQVIHQVMELWMKVAIQDLDRAGRLLDEDNYEEATLAFTRVSRIVNSLAKQILIIETIAPTDYHTIRLKLGKGSGQESPGFNRMMEIPDELGPKIDALIERSGLSLLEVHRAPKEHSTLFRLFMSILDYDEGFQRFRYDHFAIVRRIIGDRVRSLKGVPAAAPATTTTERLFPVLWDVMNELTRETGVEY